MGTFAFSCTADASFDGPELSVSDSKACAGPVPMHPHICRCRLTVCALVSKRWHRLAHSPEMLRRGVAACIAAPPHLDRLQAGLACMHVLHRAWCTVVMIAHIDRLGTAVLILTKAQPHATCRRCAAGCAATGAPCTASLSRLAGPLVPLLTQRPYTPSWDAALLWPAKATHCAGGSMC